MSFWDWPITGLFLVAVVKAIPWVVLPSVALYALSRTDFGRGVVESLRARKDLQEMQSAILDELGVVRQQLAELQGQLDFLQRGESRRSLGSPQPEPRVRTPTPV